jgi:CheY-like chemotaxis protein
VDDEPDTMKVFRRALERQGYSVFSATDPLVALEQFKKNPLEFDMIISDIKMPKMDGLKLAKEIRRLESRFKIMLISRFKIMLISAYEIDGHYSKALSDLGVDALLHKPLTLGQLAEETRKQLQAETLDTIYICRRCNHAFVFDLDMQDHMTHEGHDQMDKIPIS